MSLVLQYRQAPPLQATLFLLGPMQEELQIWGVVLFIISSLPLHRGEWVRLILETSHRSDSPNTRSNDFRVTKETSETYLSMYE